MRVNQSNNNTVQGTNTSAAKGTDRAAKTQNTKDVNEKSKISSANADDVDAKISSRAKEFAKAKELAMSAPDVREDKIAELKKRISEGKYKVDADKIADRLVSEHMKTASVIK